jgi:hypothetical protein
MLLFICGAAFITMMIYYRLCIDEYELQVDWLHSKCLKNKLFKYRMGIDYTFFDFTRIFALIGATFGCSFANLNIDSYLSQDTGTRIRFLRTVIGVVLFWGIFKVCSFVPADNYLTEYFFIKALPNFVASYFIYGLYPYSWLYLGWIKVYYSETEFSEEDSEENEGKHKMDEIMEGSEGEEHEEGDTPKDLEEPDERGEPVEPFESDEHEEPTHEFVYERVCKSLPK